MKIHCRELHAAKRWREDVGRKIYHERQDFSYLMKELNGIAVNVTEAVRPNSEKPALSARRARLLSDTKIKYLFRDGEVILHDKSCSRTEKIPDGLLIGVSEFRSDMKLCSRCGKKAIIRCGALDIKQFDKYEAFFSNARLSQEWIRRLYIDFGAKTELISRVMNISVHEDNWKLVLQEDGRVKLLHNNYHKRYDGSRIMEKGYHEQWKEKTTACERALEYICAYSWEDHSRLILEEHNAKANQSIPVAADALPGTDLDDNLAEVPAANRKEWKMVSRFKNAIKQLFG